MNKNLKISENLKKFRQQLKLTQGDVAEIIKKDRSSIAKYESGAAQPPFAVLRSLAKLYDVTIDELCGIEPIPTFVVRSEDNPDSAYASLISKFDKQEQLTILSMQNTTDTGTSTAMRKVRNMILATDSNGEI